jgi:hypothetical protein
MVPGLLSMANINLLAAIAMLVYGWQRWHSSRSLTKA